MEVNLSRHQLPWKWAWGGHRPLVAGGAIAVAVLWPEAHVAVLVLFPGLLWQVWQRIGP